MMAGRGLSMAHATFMCWLQRYHRSSRNAGDNLPEWAARHRGSARLASRFEASGATCTVPSIGRAGWCGSLAPLAADIHWNTKYLEVAYTELRRQGVTINEDLLRHVAPLGRERIGLTGDYVWSADQPPAGTLRPLRQRQSLLAASVRSMFQMSYTQHFRVVIPFISLRTI
jgi:hypothetical protein